MQEIPRIIHLQVIIQLLNIALNITKLRKYILNELNSQIISKSKMMQETEMCVITKIGMVDSMVEGICRK